MRETRCRYCGLSAAHATNVAVISLADTFSGRVLVEYGIRETRCHYCVRWEGGTLTP